MYDRDSALKVAEFLLQIKAIILRPNEPFNWASGWKSPIYCDNRKILSYPRVRTYVRQELAKGVQDNFGKPDLIAGVATGGIAHGVLVAQDLGTPFAYVRPKPKGHGLSNQIEGVVESGQSVIVIEDLISTGNSSLNAVEALRETGCTVKGMVAIFSYGFDQANENFKAKKCPLVTLTNYDVLVEVALERNHITEKDLRLLQTWREDPASWTGN
ncbi:MAG: orotate phosphoribosyltransferase [Salibacteraceae bacterium]